jgi:glycosyltransferase involved in cell wall biosynthesis
LLEEEEERTGFSGDNVSSWAMEREEMEYELADNIILFSGFSYRSFIEQGVPLEKLRIIPSGLPVMKFRPSRHIIDERVSRIKKGDPLRVLHTGAISLRKGMWDMCRIIEELPKDKFIFRFVGPVASGCEEIVGRLGLKAEIISKVEEDDLISFYSDADVFILTTIEDGLPGVLMQAIASGLPVLSSCNCAAPDVIEEGKTGWILPIRTPGQFIERLLWCDSHREELSETVKNVYETKIKNWEDIAKATIEANRQMIEQKLIKVKN